MKCPKCKGYKGMRVINHTWVDCKYCKKSGKVNFFKWIFGLIDKFLDDLID